MGAAAAVAQPAASPGGSPSPAAAELARSDASRVLGLPSGRALHGAELDAQTEDVAALLRCPVCQGLSVADSPSSAAQNMKGQIRDLLEAGYDRQQVMTYFERSYGEFVRLQPPLRGINWLLWLAPAAALLGGGVLVGHLMRRRAGPAPAKAAPEAAPPAPPADPVLEAYRERVRALAFGDESAAPPSAPPGPGQGSGETR
jgi:cytochrome c-type biogenesis protein CcmH